MDSDDEKLPFKQKARKTKGKQKGDKTSSNNTLGSQAPTRRATIELDDVGTRMTTRANISLSMFQQPDFHVNEFFDSFLRSMQEAQVDIAREDLGILQKECTEALQGGVHSSYHLFLDAGKAFGEIEEKIQLLRNYMNNRVSLLQSLKLVNSEKDRRGSSLRKDALIHLDRLSLHSRSESPVPAMDDEELEVVDRQLLGLMQNLDVAVAERDFLGVRDLLSLGRKVAAVLDSEEHDMSSRVPDYPVWRHNFEVQMFRRKQALIKVVERSVSEPSSSLAEIRSATRVLAYLVGNCHAAGVMLHCHSQKIKLMQNALVKQQSGGGGGDPDGVDYAGRLSQHTFMHVGRAADSAMLVFGSSCSEVMALFSVWAVNEARQCAQLLKRHALAPFAAPSGLAASVRCVATALLFCLVLEQTHGLSLTGPFCAEVMPHIETVLKRHFRRYTDELKHHASEEINSILLQCLTIGAQGSFIPLLSGQGLVMEVKGGIVDVLAPLARPKLAQIVKQGLREMWNGYCLAVAGAFKRHVQADPHKLATIQPIAEVVLGYLALLAENSLPEATEPLAGLIGPLCDLDVYDQSIDHIAREVGLLAAAE